MIRTHKRMLKAIRVAKKANSNRHVGGSGLRFCSDAVGDAPLARDAISNNTHSNMWLINHPGQIMESSIHDRTRWTSNKTKSKQTRNQVHRPA